MQEIREKSTLAGSLIDYIRSRPLLKRVLGGAFWSLLGTAVTRLFSLVTSIWIARHLGKEGFGGYGIVFSTLDTFALFGGLALGFTMIKFIAEYRSRDPIKAGRLLGLTRSTAYLSAGLMAVCLFVLSDRLAISMLNRPDLGSLLKIGSFYMFVQTINNIQLGALAGFEAFRQTTKINSITGVLTPLIIMPLVYYFDLTGAVIGTLLISLISYGYCSTEMRQQCKRHGIRVQFVDRRSWKEWPILFGFSIPAFISGLLIMPVTWLTNALLVNQHGGYGEMGLFNAANQWRQITVFIPTVMSSVMVVVSSDSYAEGAGGKYRVAYRTNMKLTWSYALPVAIMVITFAGPLNHLFGEKFTQAQMLIPPLIAAAFFAVLNMVASSAVTGAGRMWAEAVLNFVCAALILVLSFVLVPGHGAMGLAYANLIGSVAQVAARLYYIEKALISESISDFRVLIFMTAITFCITLFLSWQSKLTPFWGAAVAIFSAIPFFLKAKEIFVTGKAS